jgi:hypothetical protein
MSEQNSWTKGSPKSVNRLTYYGELEANSKKGRETMPGHVRAALNYNYLRLSITKNYNRLFVGNLNLVYNA